jgi:hypothetical protein
MLAFLCGVVLGAAAAWLLPSPLGLLAVFFHPKETPT